MDLEVLLDTADLAMVRSEGVLPDDARDELGLVVRLARRRLGFIGEVLVVALAGGTGSGKSSLVNALVREPVVTVSVERPTTGEALGVAPAGTESRYRTLMADLGVSKIIGVSRLKRTILVDLPDFDSVETSHRHLAEEVLPRVDAVMWVFDPEKYADKAIHRDFLSHLGAYSDQFVFVLNQVDRLGQDAEQVGEDLARMLSDDGFISPDVVPTVALASRVDIGDLEAKLIARWSLKHTETVKLVTDLLQVASRGWKFADDAFEYGARDETETDHAAVAASTFVLLGIGAREMLSEMRSVE